jgi:hypothetical protein
MDEVKQTNKQTYNTQHNTTHTEQKQTFDDKKLSYAMDETH